MIRYPFLLILLVFFGCRVDVIKDDEVFLFSELSPEISGVDFVNLVEEDEDHNILNYIYYYNGAGVAAGDLNGNGLPDLFFVSNQGENKLYFNEGNLQFTDVSQQANIVGNASWQTGVSFVDINNDGLLDIYVCAVSGLLDFTGHNELYINNGDGTFTERSQEFGLDYKGYSTQAYFFDYDKDGDLDVYIVNHAIHTNLSHGEASVRNKRVPNVGDVLLRNDNGFFVDVSEEANIFGGANAYGLSAVIADFNNDGWDDIYVCNDFHEDDYYYINNHDGTFTECLAKSFSTISRFSMGSDAADINGNGFQDLITLDMLPEDEFLLKSTEGDDAMFNMQEHLRRMGYKDQFARNMLQINRDGEYFTEEALLQKIADTDWSWAALFADFNNDSHQDLFISNGIYRRPNSLDFKKYISSAFKGKSEEEGIKWLFRSIHKMPSGKVANKLFQGDSHLFKDKTGDWITDEPKLSNGAIYVDLDLDGDLDIVTNNFNEIASIFENNTENSNFISLKFNYLSQNKEGVGTKAIVYANDKKQLKQLFKSRGFMSSLEGKLYFGLGKSNSIDSIEVIWPNNEVVVLKSPEINSTLEVSYDDFEIVRKYEPKNTLLEPIFTKVEAIDFVHREDDYNDFAKEKLIPYRVSRLGPAVALADISGNGFDDLFVGNAAGKKAQLFHNDGNQLKPSKQAVFEEDIQFEDNVAVFFDANNNGKLDLFVASGASTNPSLLNNRLYLNQNGVFKKTKNSIPLDEERYITSTVIAYDYDQDGDEDLFIGNYTSLGDFGQTPVSYILVNDGQGNFSKEPNFEVKSRVTDALWHDIDGDGVKDLIITTEWDAPYLFLNQGGKLVQQQLPENMNGLWQTLSIFDMDGDGYDDILLGNLGLNTKFNLKSDDDLLMYYGDFDKNGVKETILAYNSKGKYYPLHSKDELTKQMNSLNRKYRDYASIAGLSVEALFGQESLDKATKFNVSQMATGYLKNNQGSFEEFVTLDKEFQLAPVKSFLPFEIEEKKHLLVGGNSFNFNTYHGNYNSLKGILLNNKDEFDLASRFGIDPIHAQVKAFKLIQMKEYQLLLIITNNDEFKSYKFQK